MTYEELIPWLLMPFLTYAAYTDLKRKEISCTASLLASAAILAAQIWYHAAWPAILMHLAAGIIMAALMLVNALFFDGGGGDCFLVLPIGLALGLFAGLMITVISCLSLVCYHLLAFQRQKSYPMAPFFLIGFLLYFQTIGG